AGLPAARRRRSIPDELGRARQPRRTIFRAAFALLNYCPRHAGLDRRERRRALRMAGVNAVNARPSAAPCAPTVTSTAQERTTPMPQIGEFTRENFGFSGLVCPLKSGPP